MHPAAQQRPIETFRSGREVLTIDTSVRDADGRPLTDLKPADFVVRIDGQSRAVLTARMFGTDAGRVTNDGRVMTDVAPIPRFTSTAEASPGRIVVFAIDRTSIRPGGEKAAIETAAALLDALSPADAVGAAGLPTGGIELTRDHAAVAKVIRQMTGTAPRENTMSWEEALEAERECNHVPDPCPREFEIGVRTMLLVGRGQANSILSSLSGLLDRMGLLSAPKHLVLISGGLPFDTEILPRYQMLAAKAAQRHVALFVVHLDQPPFDATDQRPSAFGTAGQGSGGREYETGLATIASTTGGAFFMGVGRATGVFERIASDINNFYQLGVESRPSDADGKSHRVEVKVTRPNAHVRAPVETAASRPPSKESAADAIRRALAEPTDVAELPLEVAPYVTHSSDPEKVRVIIAAQMADASGTTPIDWGYVITDGTKVIAGSQIHVAAPVKDPWSATARVDIPSGQYRLRTAAVSADGRMGVLEVPLRVGLRAAGSVVASDLIVGTIEDARLQPRARVRQDERAIGLIELSSGEPLGDTGGTLQVTRAGATEPVVRAPLALRTRQDDKSIVLAEAALDVSSVPPGTYTASAVLARGGTPFARISRVFEILPGAPAAPPAATPRRKEGTPRDPAVDEVMARVGRYVAEYGQQASLIIGTEHYEQQLLNAPSGEVSRRRLVSEFALVRTADVAGWVGFRDVIEIDGRRMGIGRTGCRNCSAAVPRLSPKGDASPTRARGSTSGRCGATSTSRHQRSSS